ncbi:hypothetical protein LK996_11075 [Lysobacter sp. A6]|uniref:Cyanobacterial TRADD-N associated 2 transmembrane domain-containing protein n=1 Tax=Noviluteimonas lactosilytica TaxID=2888523 RepID=A0ABS8JJ49_9GAMM|nr:hypothetical protein [Lysobacter lactosilyticus]MCC8363610.1 hypothetical protein [Lysobacter lactosilyticus]
MDQEKINSYVSAYYQTNQSHVLWSFWASMAALTVGLVVLVVGLGLALAGWSEALAITLSAAGVLTQFISAGFFFLYNKNLKQLNVFYGKLIENQDMFFALSLVGHTAPAERPGLILAVIGKILSRTGPQTDLTPDLIRALAESRRAQEGSSP